MIDKVIYLDNNATTKVDDEVIKEMLPFFSIYYGNPSSIHTFGGQIEKEIKKAREKVAKLIGAEPEEIIFTSGGTESDNAAILSALETQPKKNHIITTKVEHPAILSLCNTLKNRGYNITYLSVDAEGQIDLTELKNAISAQTAIISIMWANNETGVIFPIEEISKIAAEKEVLFHTDAVQAIGKIPINVSEYKINFLAASGHKFHAPKGIGFLYIKKGTRFNPFIIGGHQEYGRRAGTHNVPGIIGLGKAAELAEKYLEEENTKVKYLRDKLEKSIIEEIKDVKLNGGKSPRTPNTLNISFKYVEGEAILLLLNEYNIAASSGSACTTGSLEPSHVLRAMGVPAEVIHGSIRFSLSRYTTEEEINFTIEKLKIIIKRLRDISPFTPH
ncbi:MAG TPA: cysteine desulfurase NifS [bacterium]|nr:cysteine desulfurase NifS [bacterium]HOL48523.1 cysteine desulfurase NifS [bacterium]HPQ19701.1 cysteine desulfurase NifS [bacterium]